MDKHNWQGRIVSVQPRIRLTRSFDQRYHAYPGFILVIDGICGLENKVFTIAVGKAAHEKYQFRIGMEISGCSVPVADPRKELADFYKTSEITILGEIIPILPPPPYHGIPPELEEYRSRGHRRLDPKTYELKCSSCMWGCRMPVEITIDKWNPSKKKYRAETFCYGPKSCSYYRAGATRKIPGKTGMSYEEENWVDEETTPHRDPDE